jgi:DNA-binding transcriptional LysR family regulator
MTQSTISGRIQELEETIGVSLFDRSHHPARLTPKGQELVSYAERLLVITSEIQHRVGNAAALAGVVRVGIAELLVITWLPELVAAIRKKYPAVILELTMNLTNTLIAQLRDGDLDIALIPGPVIEPNLACESLGFVEFCWMAGETFEMPTGLVTPEHLQRLPIISLSEESHHYRTIEHWFASNNASFTTVMRSNNMSLAANLAMTGLGIAHLPRLAYQNEIGEGKLRILESSPKMPTVEFFSVYPRGRFQPLVHAIAALAQEVSRFSR